MSDKFAKVKKIVKNTVIGIVAVFFILLAIGIFMYDGSVDYNDTLAAEDDVEEVINPEKEDELGEGEAIINNTGTDTDTEAGEKEGPTKTAFQEEAEKNAETYPAKVGTILYTKGNHDFTGMNYYFKGEILKFSNIENNVGNPSIWLVKNDQGYIMPIQHEYFEAEVGDIVEVWGTLSGDGFANEPGIDNVVGQTGSMHAMMVTVNGEMQY